MKKLLNTKNTIKQHEFTITKNQAMLSEILNFIDKHLGKSFVKSLLSKDAKKELNNIRGIADSQDRT